MKEVWYMAEEELDCTVGPLPMGMVVRRISTKEEKKRASIRAVMRWGDDRCEKSTT